MTEWQEEYRIMIRDCINRESRMNEWEQSFIQDLDEKLSEGWMLTEKQTEKLDQIWERVTKNG